MTLYLYKIGTNTPVLTIENVKRYTADSVTALNEDGLTVVYAPLAEECELSSLPDCSEALRAQWREAQTEPTAIEDRLASLESALAQTDETAIELYEAQEEQSEINAAQDEALIEIYEMLEV